MKTHPMVSVNHAFFTKEGRISDEDILRKTIYDEIKDHITSGATHRVNNLLEVLRMECCREGLPIQKDRIHVAKPVPGTCMLPTATGVRITPCTALG